MDSKDEIILKMLMKNSRIPLTHIADELAITETAIRKRIKKLEEMGVIKGYTLIVDPYFIGYEGVALVGIDTAPSKLLEVFESIKSLPDVKYAALSTGDHMIMFEVWCKRHNELRAVLDGVEKLNGVTKMCPALFIRQIEQNSKS